MQLNLENLNASLNEEITNKHSLLEQVKALEISNAKAELDASNAQNHSIKANIAELNASLNEEITNKHSLYR